MSEFTLKVLSGLKWWAGFFSICFLIVLLTAPSFFGTIFISGSAVGSILLYSIIGFIIGYRRIKHQN